MTETDIPLPPEWLDLVHAWAPYALAALLCTTALVHALLPIARAVERWAATTPARWDDDPAHRLVAALEWLAAASALVLSLVPRITIGRIGPAPRSRDDEAER